MEEIQETKQEIRQRVEKILTGLAPAVRQGKYTQIEDRLFEFANFLESRIVMLYIDRPLEVPTARIIRKCFEFGKIVVLPAFDADKRDARLLKVDDPTKDLVTGAHGMLEPNPERCKQVPLECIDIAIVPGVALDEKGGRIGHGMGGYDRLIPKLPATTRKVALVLEEQILAQVPIEHHDRFVDIIITNDRTIYKI
jgi:5-formyltetrahydrofolate cyclo-ligase